MKMPVGFLASCILAPLLTLPLSAQDRGGRQQGGGAATAGSTAGRTAVVSSAPVSSSTSSRAVATSSTSYAAPGSHGSTVVSYTPDLTRTSFTSSRSYWDSLSYFYWVHNNFYVNRYYFSRFYRNTEPLLTPQLAKLTMSQPLHLSNKLLASIDQLEGMMQDQQAGKAVSKADIAAKTEEIRDIAKQIRQDQSVVFFDQRKEKDLLKGAQHAELGPEAIAQMREMALDLNHQIRNLYEQKSTAIVSVEALSAPSFSSLSKGIERLSKVVGQPTH